MVTTKATVRRLPNYIRQIKSDTGELPKYWLSSYLEASPPALGGTDSSPSNLMANGRSMTTVVNGLVWEADYWDSKDGSPKRAWQSTDNFSMDKCFLWVVFNSYDKLDSPLRYSHMAVGAFDRQGLLEMRINRNADVFDLAWREEDLSDGNAITLNVSTNTTGKWLNVAKYDVDGQAKLWFKSPTTSLISGSKQPSPTTLGEDSLSLNSRVGASKVAPYMRFYECGAVEAAPSDAYVENTLIPALSDKYL